MSEPSAGEQDPRPPRSAVSAGDIRKTYAHLARVLPDPDQTLKLTGEAFGIRPEEVRGMLAGGPSPQPPPVPVPKPVPAAPRLTLTPTLHACVPPAAAMMAFKEFASRELDHNLSLVVGAPLEAALYETLAEGFRAEGFLPLPAYGQQGPGQRSLVKYLASVWNLSSRRICCGISNLRVENAAGLLGSFSGAHLALDDPRFEPHVAALRRRLAAHHPKTPLHYACLPPLDSGRLVCAVEPQRVAGEEDRRHAVSAEEGIDAAFVQARCGDGAFGRWVGAHWPRGGSIRRIATATYYADWLIGLLAQTIYPAFTLEGKRMLARFGLLAASRALRWTPSQKTRALFAALQAWVQEPGEATCGCLERALAELRGRLQAGASDPLEESLRYLDQAATEAVVQAARAVVQEGSRGVVGAVQRAAVSAVLTATFAASVPARDSWMEMVDTQAVPDELAEHCGICVAIRELAFKPDCSGRTTRDA